MRKVVCVDLDGTLADYTGGWRGLNQIGDPLPGAVEFTKQLAEFADIVIFTCRCGEETAGKRAPHLAANIVRDWLDKHGFVYHDIFVGQGKPIASAYVDDRAVYCDPSNLDRSDASYSNALQRCRELVAFSHSTAETE